MPALPWQIGMARPCPGGMLGGQALFRSQILAVRDSYILGQAQAPSSVLMFRWRRGVEVTTDCEDLAALSALGTPDVPLLGEGGEARGYALGDRRVLRLMRPGASLAEQRVRAELLEEIAAGRGAIPFATREVERLVVLDDRVAVIERRRLPGIPFSQALGETQGSERQQLLLSYLDAASQIGDIAVKREFFGDLGSDRAIRRPGYREYLQVRLDLTRSLPGPLSHLPIKTLEGIPDCSSGAFVHLDIFPGNVLVDGAWCSRVLAP